MQDILDKEKRLLTYISEKYGDIQSISDIQLKDGVWYITAESEKAGAVYFSTGNGDDPYKYTPESLSWEEHIYGGLTLECFGKTSPIAMVQKEKPYGIRATQMYEKYGNIISIKITSHWKYYVRGEITVEKKDKPVPVVFSTSYSEFLAIDTTSLSWDTLMGEDHPPFFDEC